MYTTSRSFFFYLFSFSLSGYAIHIPKTPQIAVCDQGLITGMSYNNLPLQNYALCCFCNGICNLLFAHSDIVTLYKNTSAQVLYKFFIRYNQYVFLRFIYFICITMLSIFYFHYQFCDFVYLFVFTFNLQQENDSKFLRVWKEMYHVSTKQWYK